MKKSIITVAVLVGFVFSCKDSFLETSPFGSVNGAVLASNEKGADALLIGAYSNLDGFSGWDNGNVWGSAASNWTFGSIAGGDAYKGSEANDQPDITPIERHEANANNPYMEAKWRTYYDGISRANQAIIAFTALVSSGTVPTARGEMRIAEARFLRGFYHLELLKIFGMIPFIDETLTDVRIGNATDVMPNIRADFTEAIAKLPDSHAGEPGRATIGAARVYIAYSHLWKAEYSMALPYLTDVINSGTYALNNEYHKNFNPAFRNTSESILEVQQSVNNGTDDNANNGDVLNFPYNGGPGGCCGFHQPSQNLVNAFRTSGGYPLVSTYNLADAFIPDQGISSSSTWSVSTTYVVDNFVSQFDPSAPNAERVYKSLAAGNVGNNPLTSSAQWQLVWSENSTVGLDPRLDWTVGRRGIPYLDWGPHPGRSWIRDQIYGGPYAPIKNTYYKSQENLNTTTSGWTKGFNNNNVKLMRYSDVLLFAAECLIEAGSLDQARNFVNMVRNRAANPDGFVKDGSTNAANYSILAYSASQAGFFDTQANARAAVRFERRLESGMEGHRFFDLVRWGIAGNEKNAYFLVEKTKRSYLNGAVFTANQDEVVPIPQKAITQSALNGVPTLEQNQAGN